jgi:hypothetical protein|tara:strand:+ start:304 stop:465 length:162 start_codon:yes stop_codon:yes gene_type:complete
MVMDNEWIGGLRRVIVGIALHDLHGGVAIIKGKIRLADCSKDKHIEQKHKRRW